MMASSRPKRRSRFELRISPEDRASLRRLATEAGRSESAVVKGLVREAAARGAEGTAGAYKDARRQAQGSIATV